MSVLDLLFGKKNNKKSNVRDDILESLKAFQDTYFEKWNLERKADGLEALSNEVKHKLDSAHTLLATQGNKLSADQTAWLNIANEYVNNLVVDHLKTSSNQQCCEALGLFCEAVKALKETDKTLSLAALKLQKAILEWKRDQLNHEMLSDDAELSNAKKEHLAIFRRYSKSENEENISSDELNAAISNCPAEERTRFLALGNLISRKKSAITLLSAELLQYDQELNLNERNYSKLYRQEDFQLKAAKFSNSDYLSNIASSLTASTEDARILQEKIRKLTETQTIIDIDDEKAVQIINETINEALYAATEKHVGLLNDEIAAEKAEAADIQTAQTTVTEPAQPAQETTPEITELNA